MPVALQRGCRRQSLSRVGANDGETDGEPVGSGDGDCVGPPVGSGDGNDVGPPVGASEGENVGDNDGDAVGAGVSHMPSSLHRPLVQSRSPSPTTHLSPGLHAWHSPPPQSTDVSFAFRMPSRHVAGVGLSVGANVGDADGTSVGDLDGLALGTGVGDRDGLALGASVGDVVGLALGTSVGAAVLPQQPR